MLREAWNEVAFTEQRSDRSSPYFSDLILLKALIRYEQGEIREAEQILLQRIAERPQDDVLYSAAAVLYRKSNNAGAAKDILLKGYDAMNGDSAEINYNLGLIYLDLGDISNAETHAEAAYQMGYPLPGLRRRLDRIRASGRND